MKGIRFDLRLWFAVAGFAVIAVLGAAFAMLMSNYLTTTMLDREVAVTQEFLQSILGAEGYGERVFARDGDGVNEALKAFADHVRAMPEILRVNVYGADKRILWSTDEALTGRLFEDNPELQEAMEGHLVSEIGQLDSDDKPEHIALGASATGHFIEAYLPIRRDDTVMGVVEVYKVPTALETAIDRGRRIIEVSAAIGSLVLFATLYWIVRRGALQIQRQQAELGRMEGLAAVGQMASAVAHSLRNPLSGIRSSAELLRLEHPTLKPVPDEIIGEWIGSTNASGNSWTTRAAMPYRSSASSRSIWYAIRLNASVRHSTARMSRSPSTTRGGPGVPSMWIRQCLARRWPASSPTRSKPCRMAGASASCCRSRTAGTR